MDTNLYGKKKLSPLRTRLFQLLASEKVVARRHHPHLSGAIDWALRKRELIALLPGIYALASMAESFHVRVTALMIADPDAVLVDETAVKLTWDQATSSEDVVAVSKLRPRKGYRFVRRKIPIEHVSVIKGVRIVSAALSVLQSAVRRGSEIIDSALRAGISLGRLWEAFSTIPHRRGNQVRRQMLERSRSNPWSPAERQAHHLLDAAGISGWKANYKIQLHMGRNVYPDIAFDKLGLILEIDGATFHGDRERFRDDRRRMAALTSDGWIVVPFDASDIFARPKWFIETVRNLMSTACHRRLRITSRPARQSIRKNAV